MEKLADIGVFEGLQNQANRSMTNRGMTQMSVFNVGAHTMADLDGVTVPVEANYENGRLNVEVFLDGQWINASKVVTGDRISRDSELMAVLVNIDNFTLDEIMRNRMGGSPPPKKDEVTLAHDLSKHTAKGWEPGPVSAYYDLSKFTARG